MKTTGIIKLVENLDLRVDGIGVEIAFVGCFA